MRQKLLHQSGMEWLTGAFIKILRLQAMSIDPDRLKFFRRSVLLAQARCVTAELPSNIGEGYRSYQHACTNRRLRHH